MCATNSGATARMLDNRIYIAYCFGCHLMGSILYFDFVERKITDVDNFFPAG